MKAADLIIYWAESREPLTYRERREVEGIAILEAITPAEILLVVPGTERRMVVVRQAGDRHAPKTPTPKKGDSHG